MSAERRVLTLVFAALTACAGSGPSTGVVSAKPSACAAAVGPCDAARVARARVPELLADGRLDRALRVIRKADADCPSEAGASAKEEAEIRAALSPPLEKAFADTPEAKAPMRATYRAAAQKEAEGAIEEAYGLYLKAWEAWRPNGQALLQAGLLAKTLGRPSDAQRLFDRGIAELEATLGPVRLDPVNGFPDEVLSVAWSTAGRIAVAAGDHVSILAQSSLREVASLDTRSSGADAASVESVAFSPDGVRVAWGGMDGAGVFDVASGAKVWTSGPLNPVSSVRTLAVSPDGARIAVSLYRRVALLDAETGAEVLALPAESANARSIAFAPDGATLATTTKTGDVLLFRTSDGGLARSITVSASSPKLRKELQQIAFTPDGRSLVCAASDDTIRVIDVATSRETHRAALAEGVTRLRAIAVSPDGRTIAWSAQGDADAIELWSRADGSRTRVQGLETDRMNFGGAITFSPDGQFVLFAEMNGVFASDARTGASVRRATPHAYVVEAVEFAATSETLAIDSRGLRMVDLPSGEISSDLEARSFALSPTGDRVVVSRNVSSPLVLIDARSLKELSSTKDVPSAAHVAFSGDGKLAAGAAQGVGIWFWDLGAGGFTPTFGAKEMDIDAIAFSPDGSRFVASIHDEGTLRVWTVRTGEQRTITGAESARGLAFSPDGARIAAAGDDVKLFDAETGAQIARLGEEQSFSVAYSRGGTWIAAGRGSGEIDVWDARTLALVKTLSGGFALPSAMRGGTTIVRGVSFAANESLLATGSFDGTTTLWRVPSFEAVAGIRAIEGANAGYILSPDGRIDFVGAERRRARGFALCRIGPHAFSFEVCADRFEVPGLLEKRFAGDTSYLDP